MSCRTGPLRVGRSLRDTSTLSGWIERLGSSRCSETLIPGHRPGRDDDVATTGTHATKWPLSAQEARPAGLSLKEVSR